VIAVANHPFGLLEGALLAEILTGIRPDARILANSLLASVPELRDRCIFVDPFGTPGNHRGERLRAARVSGLAAERRDDRGIPRR